LLTSNSASISAATSEPSRSLLTSQQIPTGAQRQPWQAQAKGFAHRGGQVHCAEKGGQ
jgi:hypothetical protein